MEKCRVNGCSSSTLKDGNIKMYRLPIDERLLREWKTVLQFRNYRSSDRVCHLHFADADFIITNLGWKVLAPGAVPSLNLPPSAVCPSSVELVVKREADSSENESEDLSKEGLETEGSFDCEESNSSVSSSDTTCPEHQAPDEEPSSPEDQSLRCFECLNDFPDRWSLFLHTSLSIHNACSKKRSVVTQKKIPLRQRCCRRSSNQEVSFRNEIGACQKDKTRGFISRSDCKFFCALCGLLFERRSDLESHRLSSHSNPPNSAVCFNCGEDVGRECPPSERLSLLRHHATTHLLGKYQCDSCDIVFSTMEQLWIHSEVHGFEDWCPECGQQFVNVSDLIRHVKSHKSILFYACDYCSLLFGSHRSLTAHLDTHNFERDTHVECQICLGSTAGVKFKGRYHEHKFIDCPQQLKTEESQWNPSKKCKVESSDSGMSDQGIKANSCNGSSPSAEVLEINCLTQNSIGNEFEFVSATSPLIIKVENRDDVPIGDDKASSFVIAESPPAFPNLGLRKKKDSEINCHKDSVGPNPVMCAVADPLISIESIHGELAAEGGSSIYQSNKCDKIFLNEKEMIVHGMLPENENDLTCIECGKICPSIDSRTAHYEEHVKSEGNESWSSSEDDF